MTMSTGKRGNETHRNQARIGAHTPETARSRGRGIVISTLLASVVAAVMILALAPTSFAVAPMAPGFSGDGAPHTPTPTKSANATGSSSTPTMSGDMPGMGHGSGDVPASSSTPTMSGDMPGMDHGSGEGPEPGHGTGDTPMSDHDAGKAAEESDRPLAAVLGAFGGGTSAVMLTAGFLRRKDRAADRVKAAARAVRRSLK